MPLQARPTKGLRDPNQETRDRETLNRILNHQFDDSKRQTDAEKLAGIIPINPAFAPGDVRRYGAVGDGVTDDTLAIQNAIDGAGVSGNVFFPIGVYLCSGSLTGLNFQTWRGECYELGAGTAKASLRCTLTSGTFITAGSNPVFDNIRFLGVVTYTDSSGATADSTCVAISLPNHATFKHCAFELQYKCLRTSAAYYVRMFGGDVSRCGLFMDMQDEDVYDFQVDGTNFRLCSAITASDDTPKRKVQNLKFMGGSVEGFNAAFNGIRSASFFGTYWENQGRDVSAFGFNSDASFTDDTSITLIGCLIFINHLDRFVNYSGLTGGTFVSIGNTIGCSDVTGENQYYFVPMDAGTGRVVMLGDYLDDRGTGTFTGTYVSSTTNVQNQLIIWPRGTTTDHANVGQTWVDGTIIHQFVTLANSATPSVAGGTNFVTGGTTTITDFTNGVNGQTIHVISEHAITITHGANIVLSGAVNFVMASGNTLTLTRKGGQWFEMGRK